MSNILIGHPLTFVKRIMGYIDSGKNDGATVHLGGNQIGEEGYFIQPTIFTECQPNMKIVREEIFGPVACVMKFKTEDGKVARVACDHVSDDKSRGG
jgi:acyl-CoA reductase-like NAD-dependent aldehyde dehydrogenase